MRVWTWSGAASWHVAKISANNIFLRTGVGTGFRAPGFDEKYLYFNPDLELEKSETYEFGIRVERDGLYFFDAAVYETRLENTIRFGKATQTDEGGKISGIEIQAGLTAGRWSGKTQYVLTNTENMRLVRGHKPARRIISFGVDYLITPKLVFGTDLTRRGGVEFGESVNLLDVHSSYNVNENIRFGIAARNLADKKYDLGFATSGPRRTLWLIFEIVNF